MKKQQVKTAACTASGRHIFELLIEQTNHETNCDPFGSPSFTRRLVVVLQF
jgi:hypothetical protein